MKSLDCEYLSYLSQFLGGGAQKVWLGRTYIFGRACLEVSSSGASALGGSLHYWRVVAVRLQHVLG